MAFNILTNTAASITELKRDPMGTVRSAEGETIAILNRNEPAFYCVPPAVFAYLMELAEDAELGHTVDERMSEIVDAKEISLDDL
ncbi:putative plasmid stability protein [Pectobacterium atrosepticum SCRI1043]|uniref:Plasmid stability protein n=2 Tax=Pectobacterium TaxID=122277 RepID=Q6DAD0_PECAS|nr:MULTISPECIES: hypothetical protein [Pectobacterium]AOR63535.1 plasmid stabilization protein [Pectobacterium wasabiae CFBP 3304]EJS92838.1 Plasmid stability protein StbD [Pectobacterium wasabiae CFBP 3304]KFX03144.1 plasmid stabilization protein [Pectobacterium wasabiae]KGA26832.1 plasmid stabilization protein [Pectobacterium wasabiae]MCL6316544.1 plasmid stabilization protein [Pectobacterium atrosepticum]